MDRWIVAFPLATAFLCANCEFVGNQEKECPQCAGHQLLPLARILNRNEERPQ